MQKSICIITMAETKIDPQLIDRINSLNLMNIPCQG